jgi:hypothetical protein
MDIDIILSARLLNAFPCILLKPFFHCSHCRLLNVCIEFVLKVFRLRSAIVLGDGVLSRVWHSIASVVLVYALLNAFEGLIFSLFGSPTLPVLYLSFHSLSLFSQL